uniref:Protein FAM136A n=1 Tax=Graphocephala atropunctata TaxID=36148 RepID=A0A1B6MAW5_9HEMI
MAEQKREEAVQAIEKHVENIDKMFLRVLQKEMYDCSSKCCDNKTASIKEINFCIDKCSTKLNDSHNYCTTQLNSYQNRLQRCVSQCNDEAKDKLGARPTDAEVEAASKMFENCACSCIDKHIEQLPQFVKKLQEVLSEKMPKKGNPI